MSKEKYLEKAIQWANRKSIDSLKAICDGYENPKIFTSKSTKEEIQADLSFITHNGAKHYSEVALKNENPKALVTRWKVLSFLASVKKGKLHLLVPNGHKSFTERLVNRHNIDALIHSI